jgi:hypothetical protein
MVRLDEIQEALDRLTLRLISGEIDEVQGNIRTYE